MTFARFCCAVGLIVAVILGSGSAFGQAPSKRATCNKWADAIWALEQTNCRRQCPSAGPGWGQTRKRIFDTCMAARGSVRQIEQDFGNIHIGKAAELAQADCPDPREANPKAIDVCKRTVGIEPVVEYLGCFKDQGSVWGTSGRDIDGSVTSDLSMTIARCVQACQQAGYSFAGLQYSSFCFCGNNYGRHGPATNCDMTCSGDPKQICGGGWANSVFRVRGSAPQ